MSESTHRIGDVGANAEVIQGAHVTVDKRTVISAASVPVRALHQLPPDITDFVNREEHLVELRILAAPVIAGTSPTALLAIVGPPGVGKSALATRMAHELSAHFPDAQLYVDLRGPDSRPLPAADVLSSFLRSLGVADDVVPKPTQERATLYRSLLANSRALVVLDNAHGEQQVRPLLPGGPGALVITTSRTSLAALEGSVLRHLKVMEPAPAVELIETLVGSDRMAIEPDQAAQLARLCGYLPLALRIAGARLRAKPDWSMAKLVKRLGDERRRLAELTVGDRDVRAAFVLSYVELATTEARMFRRLSLIGGHDFGSDLPGVLIDAEQQYANDVLERLEQVQLLECASEDRYRMHDLLHLFAEERLEADESIEDRLATLEAVLRWYLSRASAVDADLESSGSESSKEVAAALAWCEMERSGLVAAVERAHEYRLWEHVVRLAAVLAKFFLLRSYWLDGQHTSLLALEAARHLGRREYQAAFLSRLGNIAQRLDDYEAASTYHQEALELYREIGDRRGEVHSLCGLADVSELLNRYEEAAEGYRRVRDLCEQTGDRVREAHCLQELGNIAQLLDRYEEASKLHREALALFRQTGNRLGEAQAIWFLGRLAMLRHSYQAAAGHYQEALALFRLVGDRHGAARSLWGLGEAAWTVSSNVEAVVNFSAALTIFREIGSRRGEATCLQRLGAAAQTNGRYGEAADLIANALTLFRQIGNRMHEAETVVTRAGLDRLLGRHQEALDGYRAALAVYREIGSPLGEGNCLQGLGDVALALGHNEEARDIYRVALDLHQRIGNPLGEADCINRLGDVALAFNRHVEASQCYEAAVVLHRDIGDRFGEAKCLHGLGSISNAGGDLKRATQQTNEALIHFRQIGARLDEAASLALRARIELAAGDASRAGEDLADAVRLLRAIGLSDQADRLEQGGGTPRLL